MHAAPLVSRLSSLSPKMDKRGVTVAQERVPLTCLMLLSFFLSFILPLSLSLSFFLALSLFLRLSRHSHACSLVSSLMRIAYLSL